MKIIEQAITFFGEDLILTNHRALHWPRKQALILADLHLGKAAHFRKNGIALPTQVSVRDLQRLEYLMAHYQPEQVVIVGDLIHAGANKEVESFGALTQRFPQTHFILVKGNHDRFSAEKLKGIGISAIHSRLDIDPFSFSHQHAYDTATPTISGHIHPGVTVRLPVKRQLRFPCYVVAQNQLILPAFSLFTGLDTSAIPEGAVCYAFYEEGFFKVG